MLIPENLQTFSDPTLIITADFSHAKFYLVNNPELKEIAELHAPSPAKPDNEGVVMGAGGRMINPDSGIDQGADRSKYSKDLAQQVGKLIIENNIKDLQLIMPAEMLRRLREDMSLQNQTLISKTLDKGLMKENLIDILERLHSIPKPL